MRPDALAAYVWRRPHQWALGIDAACQAAYRADGSPPRTWDDVLALVTSEPGAVALYPSDALCTLITLSASACHAGCEPARWTHPRGVELLVEPVLLVDVSCFGRNSPVLLAELASDNASDGASDGPNAPYVPAVFGFAILAWPPLWCTGILGLVASRRGAVLGGARLGSGTTRC